LTTYKTKELAAVTGVTVRRLQWWTDHKMIKPASRNLRELFWTNDHRAQVTFIAELRRRDVSLRRIKALWGKHHRDILDVPGESYLVVFAKGSRFEYTPQTAVAVATRAKGAVLVIPVRPLP
jgi:DNA-binding transcriptional MerR regulator